MIITNSVCGVIIHNLNIDTTKTSHGYEVVDHKFLDPNNTDEIILPAIWKELLPKIMKEGTNNFIPPVLISRA